MSRTDPTGSESIDCIGNVLCTAVEEIFITGQRSTPQTFSYPEGWAVWDAPGAADGYYETAGGNIVSCLGGVCSMPPSSTPGPQHAAEAPKTPAKPGTPKRGDQYGVPANVRDALEVIFGDFSTEGIEIIYRPNVAGVDHGSSTRPGRIYTDLTPGEFFSDPAHILHEYFHVIRQWRPGAMGRPSYLAQGVRKLFTGKNKFEDEAEAFARREKQYFIRLLSP